MNIIFLDVDGPLIPGRMYYAKSKSTFRESANQFLWDPIAVRMIMELCTKHKAKVVFSTSHNEIEYSDMRRKADYNGLFSHLLHHHNRTEFRVSCYNKKDAIVQWLREHPEVKYWVLIDDEEIMPSNQVKVDFDVGISLQNFYDAEDWLQGITPDGKPKLVV